GAIALVALAVGCSAPAPVSVDVGVSCAAETAVLRQRCTVTLRDRRTGRAVDGATVVLQADMPSMPLVHTVRPVVAAPGGPPGTYHGTLELEMTGHWVIAVRVTGPVSDQVTQALEVN